MVFRLVVRPVWIGIVGTRHDKGLARAGILVRIEVEAVTVSLWILGRKTDIDPMFSRSVLVPVPVTLIVYEELGLSVKKGVALAAVSEAIRRTDTHKL